MDAQKLPDKNLEYVYTLRHWIYKWTMTRPYMTIKFWPTTSASISSGIQTTPSVAIGPKQPRLGKWLSASLVFAHASNLGWTKKAIYALQANHIGCPVSIYLAWLQLSHASNLQ